MGAMMPVYFSMTGLVARNRVSVNGYGFAEFLEVNCIIATQHGFRSGRSCLSNLLSFLDQVSKSIPSR